MSILSKKRSHEGDNHVQPKGGRRLRENERLRSVIRESTFGAAVETLDRNVRFRLTPDANGSPRWLALLLHSDAIGGLNEKAKRDESKGSLVQQITSDQIEVIALAEMLDHEFFALVPAAGSLSLLGEYQMMVDAQYHWIVFSAINGELTFDQNIGPATYAEALAIQSGAPIRQVLEGSGEEGAATWGRIEAGGSVVHEETAEDEVFGEAAMAQVVEPAWAPVVDAVSTEGEQADPEDGGSEGFYEALDAADIDAEEVEEEEYDGDIDFPQAEAPSVGEFANESRESDGTVEGGSPRASYLEYLQVNEGREFTEADTRASIARRFLADDLNLVVDMAEFEAAFGQGRAPRVNVSEVAPQDSTDWLGAQLAQMAHAANSELAHLHQRHNSELAQQHIDYTSRHIQEVIKQVSLTDAESKFGRMMSLADTDREDAISGVHSTVTSRRREVEARFSDEANTAAEAAAAQARVTHMQMQRGRRETALAQIDREVNQDIVGKYEVERQQVLNLRKVDADLGMQQGKTLILEALVEMRSEQADAEAALLTTWNARMLQVVDENRKSDVVRAQALAEHLSRTDDVEDERRRHSARIEEIRVMHAEQTVEAERRVAEVRTEAIENLTRNTAGWQSRLLEAQEETSLANRLIASLEAQVLGMSDAIGQQYADRIATLTVSRDAYADEVERGEKRARRAQYSVALLMLALAGAALVVGGVVGWILANQPVT